MVYITFEVIRAGKRFGEQEFRSGRCNLLSIFVYSCVFCPFVVYFWSISRLFIVFCRLFVVYLSSFCHLFVIYLSSICLLFVFYCLLFVFYCLLFIFYLSSVICRLFRLFLKLLFLQLVYVGLKLKPTILDLLFFLFLLFLRFCFIAIKL